jgi:CBS domain-containing protein
MSKQGVFTIQTVTIIKRSGEEQSHHVVHCPRQEGPVPLAECQRCKRLDSAYVDPHEVRSFIACRADAIASPKVPRVIDAMSPRAICVDAELSLDQLVMALVDQGLGAAAVVDGELRLVGIVSATDILKEHYEAIEDAEDLREVRAIGKRRVRDVMTAGVLNVTPKTPLGEAAQLMREHRIHQLPVLDARGAVVGMLSALDVTAWYGLAQASRP